MTWPGWENFDPSAPRRQAGGAEPKKREPRVKGARPTEVDGHLFPSQHEADRYRELRALEQAGAIEDLRLQFRLPLEVQGVLIAHYVADFTYRENGHLVVQDAKGFRTEVYRLKRKLFEALYAMRIQEV